MRYGLPSPSKLKIITFILWIFISSVTYAEDPDYASETSPESHAESESSSEPSSNVSVPPQPGEDNKENTPKKEDIKGVSTLKDFKQEIHQTLREMGFRQ